MGDLDYALELFSSWILLAYAAHESALVGYGRAALLTLAECAQTPDNLPREIREAHLMRTLIYAGELHRPQLPRRKVGIDAETLLKAAYSKDWATESVLMRMDRNAWPSNVKDWLKRLGIGDESMKWMREPYGDNTETLESRINKLVEDRNDIAHGSRPSNLLTSDVMLDWSRSIREFSRRSVGAIQVALARHYPILLKDSVGEVDPEPKLSAFTVAYRHIARSIAVDEHVISRSADGNLTRLRVVSIQTNGTPLRVASITDDQISITFSREVADSELFFAP